MAFAGRRILMTDPNQYLMFIRTPDRIKLLGRMVNN